MQDEAQKNTQSHIVSQADSLRTDQPSQRQVYHKPTIVSYGPLAKNIALGFAAGAEANSTFAV